MPQPPSQAALPARPVPRYLGLLLGLATGADFLSSLSLLIAHESVREGLGASAAGFVWIMTTYAAAGLFMTPFLERLARRWHYRDLIAAGLALFVAGAAWAAASESLGSLLAARVLQGIGGGSLFTLSRVYLQLAVPAEQRPRQVRGFILALMGGAAPMAWLTAILVEGTGWRAVFLLQGAWGLLVLLPVLRSLRTEEHTPRSLGRVDWGTLLGLAAGALLLLHGLEALQLEHGSTQLPALLAGIALLAMAVRRMFHERDPLLDPRALNGRRYLMGLVFYNLYYLINGATSFLYPRLFAAGAGLSLPTIGALLSLSGLATTLLLPLHYAWSPRIADRRWLMGAGFLLAALALAWMAWRIGPGTPAMALIGPMLLKGLFPVLCVIQIAGLTYREVAHEDFAHAYAVKNALRQVSTALAAGLASQAWQWRASQILAAAPGSAESEIVTRTGAELLGALAVLCLLIVPVALRQERLR